MLDKIQSWLALCWSAVIGWIDDLGSSIGVSSLTTILVAFVLISIVLSYTIRPAVGKSDTEVNKKK